MPAKTQTVELPEPSSSKTYTKKDTKELATFVRKYDLLRGSSKRSEAEKKNVCKSWGEWFAYMFPKAPKSLNKKANRDAALAAAGDEQTARFVNKDYGKKAKQDEQEIVEGGTLTLTM